MAAPSLSAKDAVAPLLADIPAERTLTPRHAQQGRERIRHIVKRRLLAPEGDQRELDIVERRRVERNFGGQPADILAQPIGRLLETARQAVPEPQAAVAARALVTSRLPWVRRLPLSMPSMRMSTGD